MDEHPTGLEATVGHLQTDVTELKSHVTRLDEKIDRVTESLGTFRIETATEFGSIRTELKDLELRIQKAFNQQQLIMYGIAAGLLAVLAKSFGWL
jgi:hypothetical protein